MDLADCLDQAVLDWREDAEHTYEVAVALALRAARCAEDQTQSEAATSIRDVFGTLAERIHSFSGGDGDLDAVQAHRHIADALNDWASGGDDVTGFATRWARRIGSMDAAWLDVAPSSLLRSQGLGGRFRRRKAPRVDG